MRVKDKNKKVFSVRINKKLHRRMLIAAASESRSINWFIQDAIEKKLDMMGKDSQG